LQYLIIGANFCKFVPPTRRFMSSCRFGTRSSQTTA